MVPVDTTLVRGSRIIALCEEDTLEADRLFGHTLHSPMPVLNQDEDEEEELEDEDEDWEDELEEEEELEEDEEEEEEDDLED